MRRSARLTLVALLALCAACPALANDKDDAPKARRRPPPPPAAKLADQAGLRPALAPLSRPAISLPGMTQPGAVFIPSSVASNGFASGGLRSNLPLVGDPAPQCRAACLQVRITCEAQDDPAFCAPRWAQCTADCTR